MGDVWHALAGRGVVHEDWQSRLSCQWGEGVGAECLTCHSSPASHAQPIQMVPQSQTTVFERFPVFARLLSPYLVLSPIAVLACPSSFRDSCLAFLSCTLLSIVSLCLASRLLWPSLPQPCVCLATSCLFSTPCIVFLPCPPLSQAHSIILLSSISWDNAGRKLFFFFSKWNGSQHFSVNFSQFLAWIYLQLRFSKMNSDEPRASITSKMYLTCGGFSH